MKMIPLTDENDTRTRILLGVSHFAQRLRISGHQIDFLDYFLIIVS